MIIEKTMNRSYLSNTYLVADKPGGHAVLIDTGGPTGPILEKIEELRLNVSHVLCTHHHIDHVSHNADYKTRFGCPICGHTKVDRRPCRFGERPCPSGRDTFRRAVRK